MHIRSQMVLLMILLALGAIILPGCQTLMDLEFDEYVGTITVPNLGNKTVSINAISLTLWYNEGKVEGSGKAVLDDIPMGRSAVFTDTYILKFTGSYDSKSGKLSGLVGVTGGTTCNSNCSGTSNSHYNHSSYWQAEVVSGKIINGKISADPDFKTSTFLFEANQAKLNK